jgi:hypothetical protein
VAGGRRQATARSAAEAAGIKLASPMALVLRPRRLLTFSTGSRGRTEELLDEFALAHVDAMQAKRLGLGASVTLTVHGVPVRLESRVGASRAFGAELERVKRG